MKKALWMAALLTVVAPTVFAYNDLEIRVAREVTQAQLAQQITDEQKGIILRQLDAVRSLVTKSEEYNPSLVMQAVLRLADVFFAYMPEQAGVPARVEDFHTKQEQEMNAWALLIDRPIQAGWGESDFFVISQAIDQFLQEDAYQWRGEKEKQELAMFSAIIKKYSPWGSAEKKEESGKDLNKTQTRKPSHKEAVLPLSTHLRQ